MDAVGLRELKNRLSEVVSRVKAGESVLVTDRGDAIAELRPVSKSGRSRTSKLSLADLERSGLLTPGKPNHRNLYPRMTRVLRRRSSSELLDEERGRQ
jgi:prevent-host-death family protein